ncbi:hypothetical protein, partial [Escherichia coli]|uniref:hypothetical protein n=1 Tax=Escherichia coli TaxID=562 RepID=UPI001F18F0E5
ADNECSVGIAEAQHINSTVLNNIPGKSYNSFIEIILRHNDMSPFKLINYLMMVFVYFLVMKATSIAN